LTSKSIWIIVVAAAAALCLCACAALIAAGALGYSLFSSPTGGSGVPAEQAVTPVFPPTRTPPSAAAPSLTPESPAPPVFDAAEETLNTLRSALVPVNDPVELARRLGGVTDIPAAIPDTQAPYRLGERKTFNAMNQDTTQRFKVETVLRAVNDAAYFWIEDGVPYDQGDLDRLMDAFANQIVPTNREFFGSEWTPGIDLDPRLHIVYARNLGSIAGVFSASDSYPPQVREDSNAHDMFFISADTTLLDQSFTYGVLAHEFQHMIHWYRDRNEESWVNEGFSELAAFLNGHDIGGFDYVFSLDPDIQLTDWPVDHDATIPHYGAAFLYLAYYLDRFGEEATKALVSHPENGMDGVDVVLGEISATDPLTGQPVSADDLFADWVLTNYLHDGRIGDGRYQYRNYSAAPEVVETETVSDCSGDWQNRLVHQYAADYIRLDCGGDFTLTFEGAAEVGVIPQSARSGEYAFWSNKGDESDMTLTREFDFSGVTGPITFSYSTWYDLEKDYDYAYLLASEDGQNWQILATPECVTSDPSGNSFGCAYNGASGSYIQHQIDLSNFAGRKVWLRFEMITDEAVAGEGMLIDDVAVPEIGYFSDFEADDGGWTAAGFVRIQNRLPQSYRLALITTSGRQTHIQKLALDENHSLRLPVRLENSNDEVILVVSGMTRYTHQQAPYRFSAAR
jgi:hypothetical protein